MNPEAPLSVDQAHNLRSRYLQAMAVALGVNEQFAKEYVRSLISAHATGGFPTVDNSKNRNEMNEGERWLIELVGQTFLTGSPHQEQLKFTVGSRVFSLLTEDPRSGVFTNLEDWVGAWTDGGGTKKFRSVIQAKS